MKNTSIYSMGLPIMLLSAVMAWSQSSVASHQPVHPQGHGLHANILEAAGTGISTVAPAAIEAPARSGYKFVTQDFPGAPGSYAFDFANGMVVGDFLDNLNSDTQTGFTQKGGVYLQVASPVAGGIAEIFGVNASGQMVGQVRDQQALTYALLISGGQATILVPPGATFSFASEISASGTIVGGYQIGDAPSQGFVYAGGQFTSVFFPGSSYTEADDMNAAGDIAGVWQDANFQYHGYILKGGVYTSIDVPQSLCTYAEGINDKDAIAGFYCDTNNVRHGFLYSKGTYQTIDVPRAQNTFLSRVKNNGLLVGAYTDTANEFHGFTAH